MKANEFVRKFGWHAVSEIMLQAKRDWYVAQVIIHLEPHEVEFSFDDLKRLVESWELVERLGGLKNLKTWVVSEKQRLPISSLFHQNTTPEWRNIEIAEKAIADVESCQ